MDLVLYSNTVTKNCYNADLNTFRDGQPSISYGNEVNVIWHLFSSTPDADSENARISNWTKQLFSGSGYGAVLTTDNNFMHRLKGTLSEAVESGEVVSITAEISDASAGTIPSSGTLNIFNSDGTFETFAYASRAFEEVGKVVFTLMDGSSASAAHASASVVDVTEEYYAQAALEPELSDIPNGVFGFKFKLYSEKLRSEIEYSNVQYIQPKALELCIFQIDAETNQKNIIDRIYCETFRILAGIADMTSPTQVPGTMQNGIVSVVNAFLSTGFDLQFRNVSTNTWIDYSAETEDWSIFNAFRFRSSSSSGNWSSPVPLIPGPTGEKGDTGERGDKGDTGEQGPAGAAGAAGEQGPQGETGPAGADGAAGAQGPKGDTGPTGTLTAATVFESSKEYSYLAILTYSGETWQVIDESGTVAGETPVSAPAKFIRLAAAGEDGSQGEQGPAGNFANGVPPVSFTATETTSSGDLSNGVLTRTFAQLGISGTDPVPVQIVDASGVIRNGDSGVSITWSVSGLTVDLSGITGGTSGTWKLIFGGGTVSSGGYARHVIASNTTAVSGGWYLASSDLTLTLPSGVSGSYVRISSIGSASAVVIVPASGESVENDSEGITIDKTHGTMELVFDGSTWLATEVK